MFIHKKFKGETKFPRLIEKTEEKVVKSEVTPKAEKKPAAKKKVAEKPVEIINEEKNEE